jgi:hypothetical protein
MSPHAQVLVRIGRTNRSARALQTRSVEHRYSGNANSLRSKAYDFSQEAIMSAWKHLVGLRFWRCARAAVVVTAFSLVHAHLAEAALVRVFGLAPMPPTSLHSVEKHGMDTPLFEKIFSIPYDDIEPLIRDEIKKKVDYSKDGTAGCPIPFCPDLHWKVTIKFVHFAFAEKGQPTIVLLGDQHQIGVKIEASVPVKLELDVTIEAWLTAGDPKSTHSVIEFDIGHNASATLSLWPILQSPSFEFNQLDAPGLSWPGITAGGLYPQSVADEANQQINDQLNKRTTVILTTVKEQIEAEVRKGIDAGIQQPINLKEQFLSTKLPVVGKSFQELSDAFGLTTDVQAIAAPGGVNVVATLRFSGAAGSAKLAGKLRFPKERCTYVTGVGGLIVYAIPSEVEKMNTELAAKVASSCASILPASSFKVSGYLGADPKTLIFAASALPTWKAVGSLNFIGNLIDHKAVTGSGVFQSTGYYECGFEISDLSNADIIELLASSQLLDLLGDYAGESKKLRYLEIAMPQTVLDSNWKLVDTTPPALVIGGDGHCKPLQIVKVLQVLDEFPPVGCPACGIRKFIAECPQCGITKVRDGLFEVTSPFALVRNPKFGSSKESVGDFMNSSAARSRKPSMS